MQKIKYYLLKKIKYTNSIRRRKFSNNSFLLKNVKYYDLNNQNYQYLEKLI